VLRSQLSVKVPSSKSVLRCFVLDDDDVLASQWRRLMHVGCNPLLRTQKPLPTDAMNSLTVTRSIVRRSIGTPKPARVLYGDRFCFEIEAARAGACTGLLSRFRIPVRLCLGYRWGPSHSVDTGESWGVSGGIGTSNGTRYPHPEIPLKQARLKRDDARALLDQNIDPGERR
jgi:hypothetical protein